MTFGLRSTQLSPAAVSYNAGTLVDNVGCALHYNPALVSITTATGNNYYNLLRICFSQFIVYTGERKVIDCLLAQHLDHESIGENF